MKKEKREATFIYEIQIGDKESVNMDTLTPEEREEIGKRLYHNLVTALGYKPVQQGK